MALNFADIAKKKIEDVERPPLPPVGPYRWQILKVPSITTTKDGSFDIVEFQVRAIEALDGVDPEQLSAYGEVKNITNRVAFLFDKNDATKFAQTEWRLRTFLAEHVKCADPTDDLTVALNKSMSQQFIGEITWAKDKNNDEIFHANIGKTAPLS